MRIQPVLLGLWLLSVPALCFASGGEGGHEAGIPWLSLGFHALNLAILVGVIVWFGRRPISDALRNRSLEVKRAIEDAQKARDEAQARVRDLEGRMAHFQDEVERMRRETREEAERERETIIASADREAANLRISAERAIREETRRARRSLQEESVRIAVHLAEEILRQQVSPDDQRRLAAELLESVKKDQMDGQYNGI